MKFKITDVDGAAFEIEEKKVAETPVEEEFKFKTKEEITAKEEEPEVEVKETEEETEEKADEENPVEVEESLTQEEIKSLKELIIRMPELLDLLEKAKEPEMAGEKEEDVKEVELKEEVDESKIPFTEETESFIDDSIEDDKCDDINLHDSKRSFGSVETKISTDDSMEVIDEISNAWKKRYSNGGK